MDSHQWESTVAVTQSTNYRMMLQYIVRRDLLLHSVWTYEGTEILPDLCDKMEIWEERNRLFLCFVYKNVLIVLCGPEKLSSFLVMSV